MASLESLSDDSYQRKVKTVNLLTNNKG
jgi:hypothetical protein